MKNKLTLLVTIFAVLVCSNLAIAATTVPLNSGYDHWWGSPYGVSPSPLGLPKQDDYWINVTGTAIPSFAIARHPAWALPMGSSNWVNFQNSWASAPGTSPNNLRYFIYRKCFCLQQGYSKPVLTFDLRADDASSTWLNTINNPLTGTGAGGYNGGLPRHVSTTQGFKTGSNCLYVLVEDAGVATGFDLNGNVTAVAGLLSMPAKGPNQSYAPCSCGVGPAGGAMRMEGGADDDQKVIQEIIKFAEQRRQQKPAAKGVPEKQ